MEEKTIVRRGIKEQVVIQMLNLSIEDIKEEVELDRIDFENLIEEIRVN